MVIEIKNKSEIPYGVFSNSHNDIITIENEDYNNVIDYVVDEFTNITDPYEENFEKMWTNFQRTQTNRAIQEGIRAKALLDPSFEGILLSAESRPILYLSEDNYLGVDFYSKIGENVYGKWLTNYKKIFMNDSADMYYNSYIFDRLLKTAINYEPLDDYLKMSREGSSLTYILNILDSKYGKMIDKPSKEKIEELRTITKTPIINFNAEETILNVAKSRLRRVRIDNLKKYQFFIFHKFVNNVIKKHNINYDANKFIKKMEKNERIYSVDRVYEGYLKELSEGKITENKSHLYIPSPNDILRYENEKPISINKEGDVVVTIREDIFDKQISHYVMHVFNSSKETFYNLINNQNTNIHYRLDVKYFNRRKPYKGFVKEMFSDNDTVPDDYEPTESEIKRYENIKSPFNLEQVKIENLYALVDGRTSKLSLKDDSVVLQIDGKGFPSISHYIMYRVGLLIKGFDPYNMIVNNEGNGGFFRLNDTRKFLEQNLARFKESYFNNRLIEGISTRVSQHPYLMDVLKSVGDNETLYIKDFNPQVTSQLYNKVKNDTPWARVMNYSGNVIDIIDDDDFFIHLQQELFESFLRTLTAISNERNFSHEFVRKVYQQFYENLPGTLNNYIDTEFEKSLDISNMYDILEYSNIKMSKKSLQYLKSKFVNRILSAETLAHRLFDTNVVYMTKFLIIEAQKRIRDGVFINPMNLYSRPYSKEYLAMAKVMNVISSIINFKVLTINHVEAAYSYFTDTSFKSVIIKNNDLSVNKPCNNGSACKFIPKNLDLDKPSSSEEEFIREVDFGQDEEENDNYNDDAQGENEYDEYEQYDDLMYADDSSPVNADNMAKTIILNLSPSEDVKLYLEEKIKQLHKDKKKNVYKINLWQ